MYTYLSSISFTLRVCLTGDHRSCDENHFHTNIPVTLQLDNSFIKYETTLLHLYVNVFITRHIAIR